MACRPVETTVKVNCRNFWNPPFSYQTGELCTFVLFLMDAAAKEWEIYRMTLRSMILRLTDGQSEISCLVSASGRRGAGTLSDTQYLPARNVEAD